MRQPTVVCGHSHVQFERTVGSVGMAYEDEPDACRALLGPGVELRRTPFEPAPIERFGYPRPWPSIGRDEGRRMHG